jgi:hypothetical protein
VKLECHAGSPPPSAGSANVWRESSRDRIEYGQAPSGCLALSSNGAEIALVRGPITRLKRSQFHGGAMECRELRSVGQVNAEELRGGSDHDAEANRQFLVLVLLLDHQPGVPGRPES